MSEEEKKANETPKTPEEVEQTAQDAANESKAPEEEANPEAANAKDLEKASENAAPAEAESAPSEIKVPTTVPETSSEPSDDDIVASKPDRRERSAVIGKIDRPSTLEKRAARRDNRLRPQQRQEEEENPLFEKVVHINRCAKVVAGGRRFSFAALVVVGDQNGNVGVGYGKAKEVPECIRKGTEQARKNMEPVALRNNTIPHEVVGEHDGGRIMLRPAVPGTGVIAGGGVRAVIEAAGIKDVLTKSLRSNNPGAMVFATLDALRQLRSLETIKQLRA